MNDLNFSETSAVELFVQESFSSETSRLRHIEVIAQKVRESVERINVSHSHLKLDSDLAYRAALLHDIGYVKELQKIGFHPSDGAQFLREHKHPELADLIEGHSCSPEEAILLGHRAISPSENIIAKLITYWDMRVKQGGQIVSYKERLDDILSRYGETSLVARANLQAKPRLEKLFKEIELLLTAREQ